MWPAVLGHDVSTAVILPGRRYQPGSPEQTVPGPFLGKMVLHPLRQCGQIQVFGVLVHADSDAPGRQSVPLPDGAGPRWRPAGFS